MVTIEQLAARCGTTTVREEEALTHALAVANAEVDRVLASAWRTVPDAIKDECVLRTAYSVFKQAKTNDAGMNLAADGTSFVGVANDPLRKSWDLLKRYIDRV